MAPAGSLHTEFKEAQVTGDIKALDVGVTDLLLGSKPWATGPLVLLFSCFIPSGILRGWEQTAPNGTEDFACFISWSPHKDTVRKLLSPALCLQK